MSISKILSVFVAEAYIRGAAQAGDLGALERILFWRNHLFV